LATAAAIAAAVVFAAAGGAVSLWVALADSQRGPGAAFNTAIALSFTVVGAVIASARPRNAVGWLLLAGGVAWADGSAFVDLAHHGIVASPGSVPGATALAIAGSAVRSVGWYVITLAVPIVFPDGRLAGPRWRWLKPALLVVLVAAVIDPLTDPRADLLTFGHWRNPIAPHGAWQAVSALAFLGHFPLSLVLTIAAVAQLVSRWRHGDALRRQQLLLFAAAVAVTFIAAPVALGLGAGGWIFGAAALPLPFAIGFAVLARGLYDLRTAVNRTLVWLMLSAVVVGVYGLVIVGLGGLLHVGREASWLPWAAAGAVAVSFAPLRDSLQRAVNRVTFGRWDEPYAVLAALGQRVEGTADVDRLLADVVAELEGLGLRDVAISDAVGVLLAGAGEQEQRTAMPLSAYGRLVGSLRYSVSATQLRGRDRQLLGDLAGHLGGVLHARRLASDLEHAREQLVLAREEERRRLRRDLHDGLGPALAGHLLRLDVVAAQVGASSDAAADINRLREELRGTVAEVRRVVEGLRPPALDELGLAGALRQVAQRMAAGSPMRIVVTAAELPSMSAAVEVAAFRIVTEAVTNAVKHAAAATCHVELAAAAGRLRLTVEDDGAGLPEHARGVEGHGLQTMRERAEELRGRLRVGKGRDGMGTRVTAELPLPPAQRPAQSAAVTAVAR
jgi:signal transduction histidine kinase